MSSALKRVVGLMLAALVLSALAVWTRPAPEPHATESAVDHSLDTVSSIDRSPDRAARPAALDLPIEARELIETIESGGPFPYDRDGSIFQNREHRLPERPVGYYREYTVQTPGSGDRGARRIVTGGDPP